MKHILFIAMLFIGIQSHAQFSTPKNVNTLIVVYDSIGQDSIFLLCRDYLVEIGHEFETNDKEIRKLKTKPQAINKWGTWLYSLSFTATKNKLIIRAYSKANVTMTFGSIGSSAQSDNAETRETKKNWGAPQEVYAHAEKAAWELMKLSPSHIEFKTE